MGRYVNSGKVLTARTDLEFLDSVGEAIVDRLLHPSQRVVLKGGSYRERLAKKPS